ncbi:hypothetical protein NA56DRAFT_24743 [Hyaloscypha hepaticicola]|uniref:FAD dependent oxidoreductase domain-containing protein n=1 Tax=Hyaloscypha hepaticicola TaxID=2082293 RepID=A0A2J6QCP7_9HELO|nr:hypothetical protein NA56DRAFT_24743 [Hyaloscypha hepaticicola]
MTPIKYLLAFHTKIQQRCTGKPHLCPSPDYHITSSPPASTKYVMIGSGITGASLDYKLLQEEPDASMVIREARQTSSGPTGRTGGYDRVWLNFDLKKCLDNFERKDARQLERLRRRM